MIICKSPAPTTTTTGVTGWGATRATEVTRDDATEGGEEILAGGHTDEPMKGSTRGPQDLKSSLNKEKIGNCRQLYVALQSLQDCHHKGGNW